MNLDFNRLCRNYPVGIVRALRLSEDASNEYFNGELHGCVVRDRPMRWCIISRGGEWFCDNDTSGLRFTDFTAIVSDWSGLSGGSYVSFCSFSERSPVEILMLKAVYGIKKLFQ